MQKCKGKKWVNLQKCKGKKNGLSSDANLKITCIMFENDKKNVFLRRNVKQVRLALMKFKYAEAV